MDREREERPKSLKRSRSNSAGGGTGCLCFSSKSSKVWNEKNNEFLTLWSAASKRSSLKNQGSLDWRGNPSWLVTPRGGVQFSNLNISKVVWDVNDLLSCYENLVFWALSGFGFMLSFQRMAADWKQFFQSLKSWVLFVFRRTWVRKLGHQPYRKIQSLYDLYESVPL